MREYPVTQLPSGCPLAGCEEFETPQKAYRKNAACRAREKHGKKSGLSHTSEPRGAELGGSGELFWFVAAATAESAQEGEQKHTTVAAALTRHSLVPTRSLFRLVRFAPPAQCNMIELD